MRKTLRWLAGAPLQLREEHETYYTDQNHVIKTIGRAKVFRKKALAVKLMELYRCIQLGILDLLVVGTVAIRVQLRLQVPFLENQLDDLRYTGHRCTLLRY